VKQHEWHSAAVNILLLLQSRAVLRISLARQNRSL